jgi:uncharacterized protein YdeI (YjbR/CyaY-like superfamily)
MNAFHLASTLRKREDHGCDHASNRRHFAGSLKIWLALTVNGGGLAGPEPEPTAGEIMTKMTTNPKVDAFLDNAKKWREEFEKLRNIALECGLAEELKWGQPCYTFQDRNIVLIHGFKDYCALLLFKGALMGDQDGLLVQQTANVQAGRQIRFANAQEIVERAAILKSYILEAVEVEKSGARVRFKPTADFALCDEFRRKLDEAPAVKTAFDGLTPGRRRAYLLHFSAPKQAKTRESRIERNVPRILNGLGLDD